ncbi:hypothetical protein BPOR_1572g00010 [Botrytis porri]|uniref:Uncharacterized protein n=1 Tax=Botrytis porri TaxID=87229 RepID=A0A4Z1KHH0_9HELO|nr:hypothetical protein BPOR_1572g00010 [Botrytis porri]
MNSLGVKLPLASLHHLGAFIPVRSEVSHKAFDHVKVFQEAHWHNLTSKLGGKAFNNFKTLNCKDVGGSRSIVESRATLRIRTSDEEVRNQKPFTAIPIPYVTVTLDPQGKVKPEVKNEMFDNITERGMEPVLVGDIE